MHPQLPPDHHDPDAEACDLKPCCYQRALNAPSTKVLTHAYVHLKLWIFLNLALRAPRRQEAYLLLLR